MSNTSWNQRLDDDALDQRIARGRHRMQEFMSILGLTAQRRNVAEIAEQLGHTHKFVAWAQHVLKLHTVGLEGGRRKRGGLGRRPLEPDAS